MKFDLKGIVVIVGNYGSGKTEVAINLAVYAKRAGAEVRIADLDLVNPYFRTREARKALADIGIDVVLPPPEYLQADLPILAPAVAGLIRRPSEVAILDVGGDHVGARVLASLAQAFVGQTVELLQVVNPYRPFTDTRSGCIAMGDEIQAAARLPLSGYIGNAHLMEETTVDDIYAGHEFVRRAADQRQLPLKWITARIDLLPGLDLKRITCPILPIERQLVPPWKKPTPLGPKNFRSP